VLTLVDRLGRGAGAEQVALVIATQLDPGRFESILCVSRSLPVAGDPHAEVSQQGLSEVRAARVQLLALERRRKLDMQAWRRLGRYLRREEIAVLHTHKFGSNVWGALVGGIAGVPVILAHEHTWSFEGQPLRRLLDRQLVARVADRFIAVSGEDQRRMVEIERIDPGRTCLVPNGIPPLPPPSGRDVRAELGIAADAPVIAVVGLLRAQKAHHVLLRGLPPIVKDWPDVQVLIAGEGPERPGLERLAEDLGVRGAVRFLGLRRDIPDVLGAATLAVNCSAFEGSPLSVLEYMDAGLPIVATAVGGVPELIESGATGLLVPPGDPAALGAAIAELLRDPRRAIEIGSSARERRRSEFGLDTMVRRVEALYCELLRPHGWLVSDP
jgi:glycosyltransferase involved in cell wall biosynthesis